MDPRVTLTPSVDAGVVLNPGAAGLTVRTIQVTLPLQNPDGTVTLQTAQMQVVAVADEQGRLLSIASTDALLERVLDKLEQIRFEMELRNA